MSEINLDLLETQISKMLGRGVELPTEAMREILSSIEVYELKKYDQYVKVGDICTSWGFVASGLVRTFYFKKGKDVTKAINQEGTVFSSYDSLFNGTVSQMAIEALEPTVIYSLPKAKVDDMCERYPDVERLYKRILEHYFLMCHHRIESLQFETAEERYDSLLFKIPKVLLRVPSLYVASYLSITPETLSRVRSKQKRPYEDDLV